jgi:hypothetical protein
MFRLPPDLPVAVAPWMAPNPEPDMAGLLSTIMRRS